MGKAIQTAALMAGLVLGLALAAAPARAQQIDTGRTTTPHGSRPTPHSRVQEHLPPNHLAWKPSPSLVELPSFVTPVYRDPEQHVHYVQLSAYLAPANPAEVAKLNDARDVIVEQLKKDLPHHPFNKLQASDLAAFEAKDAIRQASEQSLGHSWKGEIYIRTMLVY